MLWTPKLAAILVQGIVICLAADEEMDLDQMKVMASALLQLPKELKTHLLQPGKSAFPSTCPPSSAGPPSTCAQGASGSGDAIVAAPISEFGEGMAKHDRILQHFQGLESDNKRLGMLRKEYIHETNARVRLYKPGTRDRMVYRDAASKRKQSTAARQYQKRLLQEGLSIGIIGEIWLVQSGKAGSNSYWLFFGGARICDVFYAIVESGDEEKVQNEHVQEIMREGLRDCVIWKHDLPW